MFKCLRTSVINSNQSKSVSPFDQYRQDFTDLLKETSDDELFSPIHHASELGDSESSDPSHFSINSPPAAISASYVVLDPVCRARETGIGVPHDCCESEFRQRERAGREAIKSARLQSGVSTESSNSPSGGGRGADITPKRHVKPQVPVDTSEDAYRAQNERRTSAMLSPVKRSPRESHITSVKKDAYKNYALQRRS